MLLVIPSLHTPPEIIFARGLYPSVSAYTVCYIYSILNFDTLKFKFNLIPFWYDNNTMALVREQTIPTERPPAVGEVSANFR
jgi:hypothetical protein